MIIFNHFPRTSPPPNFTREIVNVFKKHEQIISTILLDKGLESNQVLNIIRNDLEKIGFLVERSKKAKDKIHRPVYFGENGIPSVSYEIDAYHPDWKCGLEVEAGRAWKGNAVYRDLILGLVMVDVEYLIIAVPVTYKYFQNDKQLSNQDYRYTCNLADTLFGHRRINFPYELTVIGY